MTSTTELARRVADRLVAEGLVDAASADALARRLAAGDVEARDWAALAEGAQLDAPLGTSSDAPPF